MTYLIKDPLTDEPPQLWIDSISEKCPDADLSEAFSAKSEIQNGMVNLGFGAFYGHILYSRKWPGN